MTYHELSDFILNRMRMRQVYQPVMLCALLRSQGECSKEDIAQEIYEATPANERRHIDYYVGRVRYMVGPVLQGHEIVGREGETYKLICYKRLTRDEKNSLVTLCEQRLADYLGRAGKKD